MKNGNFDIALFRLSMGPILILVKSFDSNFSQSTTKVKSILSEDFTECDYCMTVVVEGESKR